ncbi:MAG: peptide ABC transporter substrate-binding protein [Patescibacteria group bacterium]
MPENSTPTGEIDNAKKTIKKKDFFSLFKRHRQSTEEEKLMEKQKQKSDLDRQLVFGLTNQAKKSVPTWQQIKYLSKVLSFKEKKAIKISVIIIIFAAVFLAVSFYFFSLKLVPAFGGEYSEGLVGSPRYINPILAQTNDVDMDLAAVIFSGLMRRNQSQELQPDLVGSYQISEDQKEYTFILKEGIKWHDGQPVTVEDILFTFDLIKDQEVASPLAVSFKGVSIEQIDELSFKFVLSEPFTPFLSTLTFGILPKHLWQEIDPANLRLADLNLKPIGCGPFKFYSLKKDSLGEIKSIVLNRYDDYHFGRAYLDQITFKFYPDLGSIEQALVNKNVQGVSYLPKEAKDKIFDKGLDSAKGYHLYPLNFPQYTAVFFNQKNSEVLQDKNIRQALAQATDRSRLVWQTLSGDAVIIDGPILPGFIGYYPEIKKYDYLPEAAAALLDQAKWQAISPNDFITWQRQQEKASLPADSEYIDQSDEERLAALGGQEYFRKKGDKILEITLTLVDRAENVEVAKVIQENWQMIGIRTILNIVPADNIRKDVIKPRNYQALIYGEIVGADPDPYPFWHSSQNVDPGLNLAIFTDRRVDNYIEAARQTSDTSKQEENYKKFQDILAEELPAIFLYSPTYNYVLSEQVRGFSVENISKPSDRLVDLTQRYIKTKRVWSSN